ncbi:MAG: DUF1475 family protein [Candidatus Didemnitutus sp.]|nr:DUF1475 family protein [Candidatus Didemnitutus sp.]
MKNPLLLWSLRALFLIVLASMLFVTSWASTQCPLFAIPADVLRHPWFIATLVDAYWGFVTFYVWAAWKERGGAARALWLVAVLLLGNIAMAVYFLRELFSLRLDESLDLVFTRRNPGHLRLAGALCAAAGVVYFVAWNS